MDGHTKCPNCRRELDDEVAAEGICDWCGYQLSHNALPDQKDDESEDDQKTDEEESF